MNADSRAIVINHVTTHVLLVSLPKPHCPNKVLFFIFSLGSVFFSIIIIRNAVDHDKPGSGSETRKKTKKSRKARNGR